MDITLFDHRLYSEFLPLTFAKSAVDLIIGIGSFKSKWEQSLGKKVGVLTQPYLQNYYFQHNAGQQLYVDTGLIPSEPILDLVSSMQPGDAYLVGNTPCLIMCDGYELDHFIRSKKLPNSFKKSQIPSDLKPILINKIYELYTQNHLVLELDFNRITKNRTSEDVPTSNQLLGDRIFLEPGVQVQCATLNTYSGPIYLAANSEIMEGALVRGGLYLGKNSQIKMGAKIYGATSIGNFCKTGGEISNSIINSYSNKAHDGFLGNSLVGSWCNFGADTNISNLKNNYKTIKIYSHSEKVSIETNQQFLGVIMGDHCKTGINTMLNTGSVVGFCCNIYGSGFPSTFIPSFSWGEAGKMKHFLLDKAKEITKIVLSRRSVNYSSKDEELFDVIFELTTTDRQKNLS